MIKSVYVVTYRVSPDELGSKNFYDHKAYLTEESGIESAFRCMGEFGGRIHFRSLSPTKNNVQRWEGGDSEPRIRVQLERLELVL